MNTDKTKRWIRRIAEFAFFFGVVLLILIVFFKKERASAQRAIPPKTVVDLKTFFEWMPQPAGAIKATTTNGTYFQLLSARGGDLASGPAAYTFDANGKFVGCTADNGDSFHPAFVYAAGSKREQISVSAVRALMETNRN